MTLPTERARSLVAARSVLGDLADCAHRRGEMIRIPRELAVRASLVLRHYPLPYEMAQISKRCPELLSPQDVT